jgi:hypothetical protein
MEDAHALLAKVYDAYERRDFDTFSAKLPPSVDWPNPVEGGRLTGRDALRDGLVSRMDVELLDKER